MQSVLCGGHKDWYPDSKVIAYQTVQGWERRIIFQRDLMIHVTCACLCVGDRQSHWNTELTTKETKTRVYRLSFPRLSTNFIRTRCTGSLETSNWRHITTSYCMCAVHRQKAGATDRDCHCHLHTNLQVNSALHAEFNQTQIELKHPKFIPVN
jgi:hypothetical protein